MKLQDYELEYIEKWLPEASVKYKDGSPAVNLGLIITVFFKGGHLPEIRQKMVECIELFYSEFKPHLIKTLPENKWVGITRRNFEKQKEAFLNSTSEEVVDWTLSSAEKSHLAPDYDILIMAKRSYHDVINRSVIKLCFPLSLLRELDGKQRFEYWVTWLCKNFEVESGYAGLSFILPYAFERMFPYEYSLAQRFPGVMVDSLGSLEGGEAVKGLKGACWYNILGNTWLEKLGGKEQVIYRLENTPDIEVLPYNNGIILKAGKLPPALGETSTEELPPLLVKVNQLIKPIRYDGHNGLHFYSEYENLQFDEASSMKWFARFDEASASLDDVNAPSIEEVRITQWSGEIATHSGQWAATFNGTTQYLDIQKGQLMPEFEDIKGVKNRACWSLLKRDDNGSVFISE